MKKVLSVVLSVLMLCTCLIITASAFAKDYPELKLGETLTITMAKNGSDDEPEKFAKFIPAEEGWYVFAADTEYKNTTTQDTVPGGTLAIDEADEGELTQGMMFFFDFDSLSDEEKESYKEMGMNNETVSTPKFTAYLQAGSTYYLTGSQDGDEDYTTGITVEKHEHTLKQFERKNDEEFADGMYEQCEDWFCSYEELVEPYTYEYKVTEGANQTIKRGEDLTFTVDAPYEKLQSVYVDEDNLSSTDYTVEEGSTIITLSAEYLDTLSAGKHTVELEYTDGKAKTEFTIDEEKDIATAPSTTSKSKTSPKTGAQNTAVYVLAIGAGIMMITVFRRKRVTE